MSTSKYLQIIPNKQYAPVYKQWAKLTVQASCLESMVHQWNHEDIAWVREG